MMYRLKPGLQRPPPRRRAAAPCRSPIRAQAGSRVRESHHNAENEGPLPQRTGSQRGNHESRELHESVTTAHGGWAGRGPPDSKKFAFCYHSAWGVREARAAR